MVGLSEHVLLCPILFEYANLMSVSGHIVLVASELRSSPMIPLAQKRCTVLISSTQCGGCGYRGGCSLPRSPGD